jgi:hypothetical protein
MNLNWRLPRGRAAVGGPSVSVPAMDGALKPNDRLEEAEDVCRQTDADNLALGEDGVYFSGGLDLFALDDSRSTSRRIASFPSPVSCLAALGDQLAVGLDHGQVRIVGGRHDNTCIDRLNDRPLVSPVAACFESETSLLLAIGSQRHAPSAWKRDLLERRWTGSLWRIDLPTGRSTIIADGLGYPYGILPDRGGRLIVAESWAHRILAVSASQTTVIADDLPFYPARLAATTTGDDVLVCGFAPRRQIVEFVLREPSFLQRMLTTIDERHWIAPSLLSGLDGQPALLGAIWQGTSKPWAPSLSYGLVATMDRSGRFLASRHSRASGRRHGTTSAVAIGADVLVSAKGGHMIIRIRDNV